MKSVANRIPENAGDKCPSAMRLRGAGLVLIMSLGLMLGAMEPGRTLRLDRRLR